MGIKKSLETFVVPCAGWSTRFGGAESKIYSPAAGEPLLKRVVKPWIAEGRRWVFVTGPADDKIEPLIRELGIDAKVVIQPKPEGITDAVLRAAKIAENSFTVLLGDCVIAGSFDFETSFDCGIGVWNEGGADDIRANYGVTADHIKVLSAIEKPSAAEGLKCGMGIYFFSPDLTEFCRSSLTKHSLEKPHFTAILDMWINMVGVRPLILSNSCGLMNCDYSRTDEDKVFRYENPGTPQTINDINKISNYTIVCIQTR